MTVSFDELVTNSASFLSTEAIIPVLIAVVGWIVGHRLSIRAQRKNFNDQLLDRARVEVNTSLRKYQIWLSDGFGAVCSAAASHEYEAKGTPQQWAIIYREISEYANSASSAISWLFPLEEYRILFPKTAGVCEIIGQLQFNILNGFLELQSAIDRFQAHPTSKELLEVVIVKTRQQKTNLREQGELLHDLMIWLQNYTLSRITGNTVPPKGRVDSTLPHILEDPEGMLVVVRPASDNQPV